MVSTVSMSRPEKTFGWRVARQWLSARRLTVCLRRLRNVPRGSHAAARLRLTRAACAVGARRASATASTSARGVVERTTRAVDLVSRDATSVPSTVIVRRIFIADGSEMSTSARTVFGV